MPDEKAPSSGAFLPASLMYFCSGQPMHFCSGVDTSIAKTRRAIIIDEGWRSGSLAAEVGMRIVEQAFWELDAPLGRVCSEEVPIPYPRHLENAAIPQAPKIVAAAKAMLGRA